MSSQRRGFTLIELLITLTLLSVISGGIAMGLSTSVKTFAGIRRHAEAADKRRVVIERLRADLQGAWLRRGSSTTWFVGASPGAAGQTGVSLPPGSVLSLTTARFVSSTAIQQDENVGGSSGPQSDVEQVSWGLEPAPDGTQDLVRRERTPPDPQVDETQDPTVIRTVLAHGIRQMSLSFFDGAQWWQQWDTTTPSSATGATTSNTGLPEVVQVTLALDPNAAASQGALRFPAGSPPLNDASAMRLTLDITLPEPVDLTPAQSQ